MTRVLRVAMVAAAAVAFGAAALGVGVRSTNGGHAAVDEPQYLLTALSLWEDGSLDISDELAERRWRAFHDATLPVQTAVRADGRQVSPHDPLLPILLALPMGLGGWVAAKLALAALAAGVAALVVWVSVARARVPPWLAGLGTSVAFASPPLAVYGGQVYPELPAAGVVLLAVAALTGPLDRRALIVASSAVIALPWLSVKYAPVAAGLALLALWRLSRGGRRAAAAGMCAALAAAGAAYLLIHQMVWGGWTAYASGDHFVSTGEFSVMGVQPDYFGRSLRLVALLFDRDFGLVPWQAAWLLVVPASAALLRRRPQPIVLLLLPAALGWATATWLALTMHGFWWPGRQLVVVLPLLLVVVLWWLAQVTSRVVRAAAAALAATGVVAFVTLLVDGWSREITWVSGFARVENPVYAAMRALLPDYQAGGPGFWLRHVALICLLFALAVAGWRSARAFPSAQPAGAGPATEPPPINASPEQPVDARQLTRA